MKSMRSMLLAGPGLASPLLTGRVWTFEHAVTPQMSAYAEGIWRGATTAVMGRTNYEGFDGYWPPVASDPQAAPRDRALASWLDEVEKVVFSRTLEEAPWRNSRVARDVEAETRALKASPGRDILVLNSASIIQALSEGRPG